MRPSMCEMCHRDLLFYAGLSAQPPVAGQSERCTSSAGRLDINDFHWQLRLRRAMELSFAAQLISPASPRVPSEQLIERLSPVRSSGGAPLLGEVFSGVSMRRECRPREREVRITLSHYVKEPRDLTGGPCSGAPTRAERKNAFKCAGVRKSAAARILITERGEIFNKASLRVFHQIGLATALPASV